MQGLGPLCGEQSTTASAPTTTAVATSAATAAATLSPPYNPQDRVLISSREREDRAVLPVEELAWEENLRSELLEQSITFDAVSHTDSATLQPQSARLGSAGALSTGTVLSQLDRSGRIISSRRESGALGTTPGVPSSASVAITALLQPDNEEKDNENESKRDIDLGVQFRSLLLAAEDNVGNHGSDDCRFYLPNHTGGTVTPMEGVYGYTENSSFDVSLRASPDMSMMGVEGRKDYSYDCTPQIVQREGRILRSHTSGSENTEVGGLVLGPDLGLGFVERDSDGEKGVGVGGVGGVIAGERSIDGGGVGGVRRKKEDTGKDDEEGQITPWKPILRSTSFDSIQQDSDDSMCDDDDDFDNDSFLEEDMDLDPDMEFDFHNNMGLQQAILSSIADSGDDPSSQSKVFIMGLGVTLSRLRCMVVSGS
jgi:hypothetical protein